MRAPLLTEKGPGCSAGRWNKPGTAVVYTSDSLALCCLEIFVNLPSYSLLKDYIYIAVSFAEELVEDVSLEAGWNERPLSIISQNLGEAWINEAKAPILRVPTVIIPEGHNYLLNIHHPRFNEVSIGEIKGMEFDSRLRKENL